MLLVPASVAGTPSETVCIAPITAKIREGDRGDPRGYVRDAWSRYDGITGYFFRDEAGEWRRIDIADDDDTKEIEGKLEAFK